MRIKKIFSLFHSPLLSLSKKKTYFEMGEEIVLVPVLCVFSSRKKRKQKRKKKRNKKKKNKKKNKQKREDDGKKGERREEILSKRQT